MTSDRLDSKMKAGGSGGDVKAGGVTHAASFLAAGDGVKAA